MEEVTKRKGLILMQDGEVKNGFDYAADGGIYVVLRMKLRPRRMG